MLCRTALIVNKSFPTRSVSPFWKFPWNKKQKIFIDTSEEWKIITLAFPLVLFQKEHKFSHKWSMSQRRTRNKVTCCFVLISTWRETKKHTCTVQGGGVVRWPAMAPLSAVRPKNWYSGKPMWKKLALSSPVLIFQRHNFIAFAARALKADHRGGWGRVSEAGNKDTMWFHWADLLKQRGPETETSTLRQHNWDWKWFHFNTAPHNRITNTKDRRSSPMWINHKCRTSKDNQHAFFPPYGCYCKSGKHSIEKDVLLEASDCLLLPTCPFHLSCLKQRTLEYSTQNERNA